MGLTRIRERRSELTVAAERLEDGFFAGRIKALMSEYRQAGRREQVAGEFAALFRSWPAGRSAASLGICYRETDILMGDYGYWLVLYGEDFCLDREPVERHWEPSGFSEMFEADMASVMAALKQEYPRLQAYEGESVRRWCIEYYHAAVSVLCKDLMEDILRREEFGGLSRTGDFFVFFGRYRGEGEIILSLAEGKGMNNEE